jgi:hypothetical protein
MPDYRPDPQVVPSLLHADAGAAMDWLIRVFGFTERLRDRQSGLTASARKLRAPRCPRFRSGQAAPAATRWMTLRGTAGTSASRCSQPGISLTAFSQTGRTTPRHWFKARANFRFTGCCWWRSLAVDDPAEDLPLWRLRALHELGTIDLFDGG